MTVQISSINTLSKLKTPYFLIDQEALQKNITDFRNALEKYWPNHRLAYSVKTNSLPWLLKFLNSREVIAEVVSEEEYELALACGYEDKAIIYNGPIKNRESFIHAINSGAYVNVDSKRELEWLTECNLDYARIGIRINLPTEIFDENDIGYPEDGFRFGYSEENGEFWEVYKKLNALLNSRRIGFHMHCNSITRAVDVYEAIAKYAVELAEKYDIHPSFIDIGGGFFGGVPRKSTPNEYLAAISEVLKSNSHFRDTLLIVEPGSAIIGSTADFYSTAIDVKSTAYAKIVTTDGSRINIDPLWKKSTYSYTIISETDNIFFGSQIICGYTCMDHDRIMKLIDNKDIRIGDQIIYHRVGAYSITFGGPFIRFYPDVYVLSGNNIIKVRNRFGLQDYLRIQS